MISQMNVTHRLTYSIFTAHTTFNGKTEWVRGSVHYDTNKIMINDPFRRKIHEMPLDDFHEFDGDMKEYVGHIITTNNEDQ